MPRPGLPRWEDADVAPSLARKIDQWLKDAENPADADTELLAVGALFGNPPLPPAFHPPKRVRDFLLARRLRYRWWQARKEAAYQFQYMLEDDVPTLLVVLRDGLNDSYEEVRAQAVWSMQTALDLLAEGGPPGRKWDAATKAKIGDRKEDYVDEIADLLITKALGDQEYDVAFAAYYALDEKIKPNRTRLRALQRIIDRKHVHLRVREQIDELHAKWSKAVDPK
jgi:hypothetical protein